LFYCSWVVSAQFPQTWNLIWGSLFSEIFFHLWLIIIQVEYPLFSGVKQKSQTLDLFGQENFSRTVQDMTSIFLYSPAHISLAWTVQVWSEPDTYNSIFFGHNNHFRSLSNWQLLRGVQCVKFLIALQHGPVHPRLVNYHKGTWAMQELQVDPTRYTSEGHIKNTDISLAAKYPHPDKSIGAIVRVIYHCLRFRRANPMCVFSRKMVRIWTCYECSSENMHKIK
jgi:hypothetical protein